MKSVVAVEVVERKIILIRGRKVIVDVDLAELYGVTTKAFNQAVKRNMDRFPDDFMFQLTADEARAMRSQFVTASKKKHPLPAQCFYRTRDHHGGKRTEQSTCH